MSNTKLYKFTKPFSLPKDGGLTSAFYKSKDKNNIKESSLKHYFFLENPISRFKFLLNTNGEITRIGGASYSVRLHSLKEISFSDSPAEIQKLILQINLTQ